MAIKFSSADWSAIRQELNRDPQAYGLPSRSYGSLLFGSFNIRKLGKLGGRSGRDDATMRFLADTCRAFDLVAIQEVMADMAAIRRLQELMGSEYGLIVSDIVGTFPGERGNEERLAYVYNRNRIHRAALVTDVSTSWTKVLKAIAEHHQELFDVMDESRDAKNLRHYYTKTLPEYLAKLKAGEQPAEPDVPKFGVDVDPFLQFIRTPFAAAFEVQAHPGVERYEFLAVNAHLQFGRTIDRRAEAVALFEWIVGKVLSKEAPNIVLLGDLNFDLDKPQRDLVRITERFDAIRKGRELFVSFPFVFPHPNPPALHPAGTVYRTNIGLTQTYDQIGVFSRDPRVGKYLETTPQGHGPETGWGQDSFPDYGVFNFSNLFSVALEGKPLVKLGKEPRKLLLDRYQHKVSDHMPIWYRIPLPPAETGFPLDV